MARPRLLNWNKQQLRGLLLLFFLALAIPTGILFRQAYSQLKWEAFHRHRLMAEELVTRIDQRYYALINIENARAFTDYAFLNIAGDAKANILQRSQLSSYPVEETIPGTVGYFQIDNKGRFSTPLVPADKISVSTYGINKNELVQRHDLHQRLYTLLSDNRMLAKQDARKAADLLNKQALLAEEEKAKRQQELRLAAPAIQSQLNKPLAEEPVESVTEVLSQSSFDQLQESEAYSNTQNAITKSRGIGKLEDLKLEKTYQKKLSKQAHPKPQKKALQGLMKSKRKRRKEQSVLPYSSSTVAHKGKTKTSRVSMFESEIDTLEFGILDSGHFVLYRKVWRDGQRYIQGLLLEPKKFLNTVIRDSFYQTAVSQSSSLVIAYQNDILSAFNNRSNRGYLASTIELQGTLLLQNRLSDPFGQLELIFSIEQLPAGPGGAVLTWTAVVLLLVFCGGFYLMYRLGLRQITLARQQQDFVSAVSHELKTPLTSIRMYGEILREGWADEAKRKTYYNYIYDESERLSRLINNVLQLARMTRNDLQAELNPCSVSQLLDNLRSKVQSQIDHAGFTLNIDCDESIAEQCIEVDADYFSQIIINLVDNAIKFSTKTELKQIDIICQQLRDGQLQISLRDYGPGIPKDQLRKIFQLFYRTENELTRETVGTGIGLALVQQLVQAMHGKIDVVNQEPGVEFRIVFPAIETD